MQWAIFESRDSCAIVIRRASSGTGATKSIITSRRVTCFVPRNLFFNCLILTRNIPVPHRAHPFRCLHCFYNTRASRCIRSKACEASLFAGVINLALILQFIESHSITPFSTPKRALPKIFLYVHHPYLSSLPEKAGIRKGGPSQFHRNARLSYSVGRAKTITTQSTRSAHYIAHEHSRSNNSPRAVRASPKSSSHFSYIPFQLYRLSRTLVRTFARSPESSRMTPAAEFPCSSMAESISRFLHRFNRRPLRPYVTLSLCTEVLHNPEGQIPIRQDRQRPAAAVIDRKRACSAAGWRRPELTITGTVLAESS